MPILRLGVIELPYQVPPKKRKARKVTRKIKGTKIRVRERQAAQKAMTTGDVATILEDKYHVMEVFYEMHKDDVVLPALLNSLQGSLESVLMGGPPSADPFKAAGTEIENAMKSFINNQEMEKIGYPGVPTQAALKGINRRLSHPFSKNNPRRPSFLDYGLYQSSMKAWVE